MNSPTWKITADNPVRRGHKDILRLAIERVNDVNSIDKNDLQNKLNKDLLGSRYHTYSSCNSMSKNLIIIKFDN